MPDTDDFRDAHGGEDEDGYSVVSNDPGPEYDALRVIHRHSDYDALSYTAAEPYSHTHRHNHGGLVHGHQHHHSDGNIKHHPDDDHDGDTNTSTGD